MKLYVCWNTNPGPAERHPCGKAHRALREAGHDPEVVKVRGSRLLPDALNPAGRREVKGLTGRATVPVLVTDDGEVVGESARIVEWASANPA